MIDIHTHTFPEKLAEKALRILQDNSHSALFSDGTEAGLAACEKRAGMDLAVVQPVATNPEKVPHINDAVIETNRRAGTAGILSFGAMHPRYPMWEGELERLKASGVPGIKLHPPYQRTDIDDPRSLAILRKCRDLGLIVLIHSGWDIGLPGADEALPRKVRRALDAVGPLRLIAAHMGGWGCWKDAIRDLAGTGIFIDTSFSIGEITPAPGPYAWKPEALRLLAEEGFMEIAEAFGTGHILFGTDSPWADPAAEVEKIRKMPLSRQDLERILQDNAKALLFPLRNE